MLWKEEAGSVGYVCSVGQASFTLSGQRKKTRIGTRDGGKEEREGERESEPSGQIE